MPLLTITGMLHQPMTARALIETLTVTIKS